MRDFLMGALFGLLFSSMGLWILKFSHWALLPELPGAVFLVGGTLMGGLIHLLLGSYRNVTTD